MGEAVRASVEGTPAISSGVSRRLLDALSSAASEIRALTLTSVTLFAGGYSEPNPFALQVGATRILYSKGLANTFALALAWNDTNAGNALTNRGGSLKMSPLVGARALGLAIAELVVAMPEAVIVTTTNQGLKSDNGDRGTNACAFLAGPDSRVAHGLVEGKMFGARDYLLTNGARGVVTPSIWHATALRALGASPVSRELSELKKRFVLPPAVAGALSGT